MIFHYTLTKEKFRKLLFRKQQKTNVIYLILYAILYFCFCYRSLLEDALVTVGIFLIGLILLWLVLLLLNYIFTVILLKMNENHTSNLYGQHVVRIEEDQIVENVDDEILILKKDEIKKILYQKKVICIFLKQKGFVIRYEQNLFDDLNDFEQLVMELKKFEC